MPAGGEAGTAGRPGITIGAGNSARPVARSITKASKKAEPFGDTFSVTSSDPRSPNSARAENPVFRARLASFPAAALLIVASCDPPALFRSVTAALTLSRFDASGEVPPRPKPSAVSLPRPRRSR